MANFDEMLAALHEDGMGGALSDVVGADQAPKIIVTAARAFEFDKGFDKVIAYEGDINSQIITFKLPELHEGHSLSKCKNKKVRWINQASKVEGTSVLTPKAEANEYEWNVPPALFTKSGTIEFSIVVYDLDADNKIGFSWNTAPCTALSIGKSIESVGGIGNMPALNEILIIDEDSRTIVAPVGYNTTIANSGDKNTSVVYFQTKRYIKGIDLTEHTAVAPVVHISYVLNDGGKRSTGSGSIEVVPYTSQYDGITNELVLIIWRPEAGLTADSQFYGSFQTLVSFKNDGKVWNSAPYNGLRIGKSLDYTDNPGGTCASQLSYKFLGKDYSNKGNVVEISAIIAHQVHTEAEWRELEYVPEDGEVIYSTKDGIYYQKVGNGLDKVEDLPTSGLLTSGSGKYSMQIPELSEATGFGSVALGGLRYDYLNEENFGGKSKTIASGNQSLATGGSTIAKGDWSATFGKDTAAYGGGSFAGGGGSIAGVSLEQYKKLYKDRLTDKTEEEIAQLYQDANERSTLLADESFDTVGFRYWFATAVGESTEAIGRAAFAEGYGTDAMNDFTHAEGYVNRVYGKAGHGEGGNNTVNGDYAHAEGGGILDGNAVGNIAEGLSSHAEGVGNKVYAVAAHVEGRGNTIEASGEGTHVEGGWNSSTGKYSHIEGQSNKGTASSVHVEGLNNIASHARAHVEGQDNRSSAANQHVLGKYCKDSYNAVVIVGNGDADAPDTENNKKGRSNAYELDWSGNAIFAGRVQAATPTENEHLTRKDYVDGKVTETLTSAENYTNEQIKDLNIAQYTTEQEVKDIIDKVILDAADSETYNSLTKLVDYLDTHGAEAAGMSEAIIQLEKDVDAHDKANAELSDKINTINTEIANLKEVDNGLQTSIKTINTNISTLRDDFTKAGNLPIVTTENNGQFLRVVDGSWSAVVVLQAEGDAF